MFFKTFACVYLFTFHFQSNIFTETIKNNINSKVYHKEERLSTIIHTTNLDREKGFYEFQF